MTKYIEKDFPIERLNPIAEKEGNARKPIYQIHKWWARRLGCIFRMILLTSFLEWEEVEKEAQEKLKSKGQSIDVGLQNFEPLLRQEMENILWQKYYSKTDLGGKTVLDPFMGGGTTIVESLRLGLKPIGIDLNPVAWFVTKKEVDPVDLNALNRAFKKVEVRVAERIKGFYKTQCSENKQTSEPGMEHLDDVIYVFWVKKVRCVSCGNDVKLFNNFRIASKKDAEILFCPYCGEVFGFKGKGRKADCPNCHHGFDYERGYTQKGDYLCPSCSQRYPILKALKAEGDQPPRAEMYAVEYYCPCNKVRGYKKAQAFDLGLFEKARAEFEQKRGELLGKWIPEQRVMDGLKPRDLLNHNYQHFYQMFNERQLLLLSELLQAIAQEEDGNLREFLLMAFSDALEANNIFSIYHPKRFEVEGVFLRHAYWPCNQPVENAIWGSKIGKNTFIKTFKDVFNAKQYIQSPFERRGDDKVYTNDEVQPVNGRLLADSSESLAFLEYNLIDAVITDPPYYDNVMYSELSDFFYVWQRLFLKDRYDCFKPSYTPKVSEIVVNPKQGKDEEDFIAGLTNVFKESHRVLQDDGLMVFTFHHKQTEAWASALRAVLNAGFLIEASYPIHSETRSPAHILNKKSITYDTIIVCRKKNLVVSGANLSEPKDPISWETLKERIYIKAREEIEALKRAGRGFLPLGSEQMELNFVGANGPSLLEVAANGKTVAQGFSPDTDKLDKMPVLPIKRLSEADIFVIVIGKCLEIFSKYYPMVRRKNDEKVEVEQAVSDIEDTVESILLEEEVRQIPATVDEETRFYLAYLLGLDEIGFNELNKRTRSAGFDLKRLEDAYLLLPQKGTLKVFTPKDREEYLRRNQRFFIDWLHYLYNLYKERLDLVKQIPMDKADQLKGLCDFSFGKTKDRTYLEVKKMIETAQKIRK